MELNESKTKSSKTSELTNIVEAFIYSKFLFCFLLELEQNVESVYTLRIPKLSCVCRLNTCWMVKSVVLSVDICLATCNLTNAHSTPQITGLDGSVGCGVRLETRRSRVQPPPVGNILSRRLIAKYFLRSFSLFRWFKKGSCQFLAKECAQYWFRGLNLPSKRVVR